MVSLPNCTGLALPRPVRGPLRFLALHPGAWCGVRPSPLLTPGPNLHHAAPTLADWAITPSSARMVGQVQQTQDNGAWMLDRGFAGVFAVVPC